MNKVLVLLLSITLTATAMAYEKNTPEYQRAYNVIIDKVFSGKNFVYENCVAECFAKKIDAEKIINNKETKTLDKCIRKCSMFITLKQ